MLTVQPNLNQRTRQSFKGIYISDEKASGTLPKGDIIDACRNTPSGKLICIEPDAFRMPTIVLCNDENGNHITQHNEYVALANRGKQKTPKGEYYQGLIDDAKKLDAAGFKRFFEQLGINFDNLKSTNILRNHTAEDLDIIAQRIERFVKVATSAW